jgi:hypothetical protein
MFRKLVAHLPFSPALVGQLGFYAKRLKKEELTRRLGLVFTALALVVQSFTVFSPPEAANASNPSDMIHGGAKSVQELLSVYDQSARGKGDFKDIMNHAGVTRSELASLKDSSFNSRQFGTGNSAVLSWGRVHRLSSDQGEKKHTVPRSSGSTSTIYTRPIWRYDSTNYTKKYGSTYDAFVGHSKKIGWFAIMKDCGNLITNKVPDKPQPVVTPVVNSVIKTAAIVVEGKQAANLTQNISDAHNTTANANDRIEYTIYAENSGTASTTITLEEHLGDVLEYASLRNNGGGSFNDDDKILSWGEVTLEPSQREERKFVVDVNSEIPATPRGVSDPGSYDCRMDNAFGNTVSINVNCSVVKVAEQTVSELPKTGAGTNIVFGASLLVIVTYFYARSRQTSKEVRLIRRDFNTGTI